MNDEYTELLLSRVKRGDDRCATKLVTFMRVAETISTLSTCKRKSCGCLLLTPDFSQVLAVGYNGPAVGEPNDSCTGVKGGCGCLHAEANCLVKPRPRLESDLVMLVTRAPCAHCAGLVLNAGCVGELVYGRSSTGGSGPLGGLTRLKDAGLVAWQLGVDEC